MRHGHKARLAILTLVGALALLMMVLFPVPAQGSHTAGFFYTVEVGATGEQLVTPLVGTTDVATFYDYGSLPAPANASANTGLEKSDTSILFVYEDPLGNVSLVMIHDIPNDGSGGRVDFAFAGVPVGTSFVVRDDAGGSEAVLPASIWRWNDFNTDGGALSGTLNGAFAITITPSFPPGGGLSPGAISSWEYLDGTLAAPVPIPLDVSDTATVRARPMADIDIKPGSDPNCLNPNGNGVIPVAILTTATFDATTVDPASLSMEGAPVAMRGGKLLAAIEDVDFDGDLDLVVKFEDDGSLAGKTSATVIGQTFGGTPVVGTDSVCTAPKS